MSRNKKLIFGLFSLFLISAILFVFMGLNADNWDFNFPRRMKKILAVILVSFATGYSSTSFQTITNNHILTPSVMGLDNLYLFLQTVVVFFFGGRQLQMMTGITNFLISVLLMVGASFVLYYLMFRGEEQNVYFLVLVGMIFGTFFNGLSSFMQVLIDPNEFAILEGRIFASFSKINSDLLWISLVCSLIILLLILRDIKFLDVLSLGKDPAVNLGVPYKKVVQRVLIFVSILVSISTVLVGPIAFLGILVISLTRNLFKSYRHSILILGSTLMGALILTVGLFVTERIMLFAAPLSVVVNFVGGVYFLILLLKERKV